MGIRVLVVQHDPVMAALLRDALAVEGHVVESTTPRHALDRARALSPDVVMLDWPERPREASELCVALRRRNLHGLLVTCIDASAEQLRLMFESGADDVVRQPFDLDELLLRVAALGRRAHAAVHGEDTLVVGAIHLEHGQARVGDKLVPATQRELAMLMHLARRANRAVTTAELGLLVWGRRAPTSNAIVAHVNHLRSKLGRAAAQLRTVRGVGYLLSSKIGGEDERERDGAQRAE
jgi:DNA-binding response OmpR family regulator